MKQMTKKQYIAPEVSIHIILPRKLLNGSDSKYVPVEKNTVIKEGDDGEVGY